MIGVGLRIVEATQRNAELQSHRGIANTKRLSPQQPATDVPVPYLSDEVQLTCADAGPIPLVPTAEGAVKGQMRAPTGAKLLDTTNVGTRVAMRALAKEIHNRPFAADAATSPFAANQTEAT